MAVIFHFLANRKITFKAVETRIRQQIVRYLLLTLLNYVIQVLIIRICYEMYGINFYVSAFLGILSTMVTGYVLMNLWVFKKSVI